MSQEPQTEEARIVISKPQFIQPKLGDGWLWLVQGFKLFWRNPWALSSSALIFMMLPMLLASVPQLGTALSLAVVPGLAAGAMYAAFAVESGLHPLPHNTLAAFFWGPQRKNLPRLRASLLLGVGYALVLLGLTWLLRQAAGEAGAAWMELLQSQQGEAVDMQQLQAHLQQSPQLVLLALVSFPVLGLVFFLFSRAAMLSLALAMNPGKALFFAAYSVLKSLPALLLYAVGLGVALMLAAQLMLLHPFLYALGLIAFAGVLLCSLWVSFSRSFPPPTVQLTGVRRKRPDTKD